MNRNSYFFIALKITVGIPILIAFKIANKIQQVK